MGKIYKNQTDLTIKFETCKDLTGISSVVIKTKNPNGVDGTLPGIVLDAKKGIVAFNATNQNKLEVAGVWTFWVTAVDTQGLLSIGEPCSYEVFEEGL